MNDAYETAPRMLERMLERALAASDREAILGDLAEEYAARCAAAGREAAARWYRGEAACALIHAIRARARKALQFGSHEEDGMDRQTIRSIGALILLNVAAFAAFWLVGFVLIQAAERLTEAWQWTSAAQVLGSVFGVMIAIRLRARLMAYFLVAMTAYSIAQMVIHLIFGIGAAQGGPTHFAVMGAAVLSVALGVGMARYFGRPVATA